MATHSVNVIVKARDEARRKLGKAIGVKMGFLVQLTCCGSYLEKSPACGKRWRAASVFLVGKGVSTIKANRSVEAIKSFLREKTGGG